MYRGINRTKIRFPQLGRRLEAESSTIQNCASQRNKDNIPPFAMDAPEHFRECPRYVKKICQRIGGILELESHGECQHRSHP